MANSIRDLFADATPDLPPGFTLDVTNVEDHDPDFGNWDRYFTITVTTDTGTKLSRRVRFHRVDAAPSGDVVEAYRQNADVLVALAALGGHSAGSDADSVDAARARLAAATPRLPAGATVEVAPDESDRASTIGAAFVATMRVPVRGVLSERFVVYGSSAVEDYRRAVEALVDRFALTGLTVDGPSEVQDTVTRGR